MTLRPQVISSSGGLISYSHQQLAVAGRVIYGTLSSLLVMLIHNVLLTCPRLSIQLEGVC